MPDEDEGYIEDWSDLKKPELIEECEARGLSTTGTAKQLVARLEEDDAKRDAAAEEPEPTSPAASEPVGATPDPEPEESSQASVAPSAPTPGFFAAEVPLGDWDGEVDDEDLASWRLQAWHMASDAGYRPIGGAFAAAFVGYGDGVARFEVPLAGE